MPLKSFDCSDTITDYRWQTLTFAKFFKVERHVTPFIHNDFSESNASCYKLLFYNL